MMELKNNIGQRLKDTNQVFWQNILIIDAWKGPKYTSDLSLWF